jgi:hypothetical protein
MNHSLQYWRSYFNTLADRELIQSWLQHGRPSEDSDNIEAWQAVNEELFNRTLDSFYDRSPA